MKIKKIFAVALVLVLMFSLLPAGASLAASGVASKQVDLVSRGTTNFTVAASASQEVLGNLPNTTSSLIRGGTEKEVPKGEAAGRMSAMQATAPLSVPVVASSAVTSNNRGLVADFNGISHRDQRLANGGNQWSLEPPDQGLCVGNGYVLEAVNLALAVYDTRGNVLKGVTDLNTFFGYPAAIDRTTGVIGPFLSDPKCMFDVWTGHWFVSILELDTDPSTGAFTGPSHVDIAVSQTKDPTGNWYLYSITTTNVGPNDTVLPGHPGCPCFGDQPLIGYNQDAFIVSTNEFSVAGPEFNGAQIYAMPKLFMELGKPVSAAYFDNLMLAEGQAYSVQPAFPNSPLAVSLQAGGTEYFLSSLEFTGTLDNRIAVWALTGTQSLYTFHPSLMLNYKVLTSETYGMPIPATQKAGPYPLGQSLGDPENMLNTNDDRMNQVQFNGFALYSGVNTILNVGGADRSGIAYFVVAPSVYHDMVNGRIINQGYVGVANNYVMFPSIGVSLTGRALMTFTLSGDDYYPSAAYSGLGRTPVVHVAAAGAEPADGFTGYPQYGGNGVERWGDYSAAVTNGDTVWMAVEYIPGGPRTSLANWGTRVFAVETKGFPFP